MRNEALLSICAGFLVAECLGWLLPGAETSGGSSGDPAAAAQPKTRKAVESPWNGIRRTMWHGASLTGVSLKKAISYQKLLLERLNDRHRIVRKVVLPTRLMVRASCGCPLAPRTETAKSREIPKTNEE